MKSVLCVAAIVALTAWTCDATATRDDVERCYNKLVEKLRALNGDFVTQEQGVNLLRQTMDQYLNEGQSLQEIADYARSNINNMGFDSEQSKKMADVYSKIVEILGNEKQAFELYQKSLQASFDVIAQDKQQVDAKIAELRKTGATTEDIQQAVCQQVFQLTTLEKKKQVEQQIGELIPESKREAVREALSVIIKL